MELKDIVSNDVPGLKDKHCAFSSIRKLKVDLESRIVISGGGGQEEERQGELDLAWKMRKDSF